MARATLSLALVLGLAGMLPAQEEIKDGKTYVNTKYNLTFSIPSADWGTMRKGDDLAWKWTGGLCEILDKDQNIGGCLQVEEVSMTVEKYADAIEKSMSKVDGVKDFKQVKNEKQGEWLRREHISEYKEWVFHYVSLFGAKGKASFRLCLWVVENMWEDKKGEIDKIGETFAWADKKDSGGGGDKTGGGGGDKPKAVTTVKVPEHMWKDFGVGTSVTYKMNTSGMEMETITTLLWKDDKSYVVRSDTVMSGNKMEGQPIEYVVEKATGSGDGGSGDKPKITEGDEEIEVPAGKFKCHWTQVEMEKPIKSVSKTWSSKDVPGGMVKMESEASGSKTTMVLVKFEKK